MKERPIIFSGPMVRAILGGRKTQTRRIVKAPRGWPEFSHCDPFAMPPAVWWWNGKHERVGVRQECPYGVPGDRLYVRETTREDVVGSESMTTYVADGWSPRIRWNYSRRTRPAIHLPKKLCRLWLEVTGVRVERLQEISEHDAKAEGAHPAECCEAYFHGFAQLWDKINAKRAPWESNPWVWVIEFRRIAP